MKNIKQGASNIVEKVATINESGLVEIFINEHFNIFNIEHKVSRGSIGKFDGYLSNR